ncbi:hypothetical protein SAMN05444266_107261 [Chitinophaga jiangningensis]|uniref:Uncharacterized protein n=1 Tax=Chitinophaga jiangningensis TaxID=1419482 RepID=A0A1M7HK36_9BACT|nr:hypothetical protein SAMN05444266_107261 [Chitinophaga jiangningensis]
MLMKRRRKYMWKKESFQKFNHDDSNSETLYSTKGKAIS